MLNKDFEKLLDIGMALSSIHDLEKLLDMIVEEAQGLTNADGGSLYLLENDKLGFKVARSNTFFKRWGEKKTHEMFSGFAIPITKQSIAGYVAITARPLNIPDVSKIPASAEYRYNSDPDRKYKYKTVSMLTVPMINHRDEIIGILQLINSMEGGKPVVFSQEHEKITFSLASQAAVAIENAKLTEELRSAYYDTILRLSSAAEFRDKETSNHIKRVSLYSRLLAEKLDMPREERELIFWASPMHDIGKLGIPDAVLLKPGKLTPEERKVMEQHTIIGAMILKGSKAEVLVKSRVIAITHHEKYDGSGYPAMTKGENIPIEGRIVAIADVFDALSSRRPYKEPFPENKVLEIMKEGRGTHFDPQLLDMFLGDFDQAKKIRDLYADKDEDFNKPSSLEGLNPEELLK